MRTRFNVETRHADQNDTGNQPEIPATWLEALAARPESGDNASSGAGTTTNQLVS